MSSYLNHSVVKALGAEGAFWTHSAFLSFSWYALLRDAHLCLIRSPPLLIQLKGNERIGSLQVKRAGHRLFLCPFFLQIYPLYSIHPIPGREHTNMVSSEEFMLGWSLFCLFFFLLQESYGFGYFLLGISLLQRVMSPLVNFSQVHLSPFCLISSHFLSTLAHLLQGSSLSLHALFLFLYSASWLMSHTPLLREQTKSSIHSHEGCFKRGTWTGGLFTRTA